MKRTLSFFLAMLQIAVLFFGVLPVQASAATTVASGSCGDNLTWTLDDYGLLTISGTGPMEEFGYAGAPWTDYSESITSAVIGDGVTSISEEAFAFCRNMTDVTIGSGVTSIARWAFFCCSSLESVFLPAGVTELGTDVFNSCASLTGIWVDENNPRFKSDVSGVLIDKDLKKILQAPGAIEGTYPVPEGLEIIGQSAFG